MPNPSTLLRIATLAATSLSLVLLAVAPAHAQSARFESLATGIIDTVLYSFVGIVMAAIGFKVVDWLTPGGLAEEIAHKENRALATVAGAMILGICIIIAGVITGG